jgi:NAD-dependent dihydropyrimidine dehydrogenase PreA subunit
MPEKPVIDPDLCTACNACIDECPAEALYMNAEGTCAVLNAPQCTGNGVCETACPTGAIELVDQD